MTNKDIKSLIVTLIKIFPNDYIPYAYLMRTDFIDYMVNKYKFKKPEIPFDFYQKGAPNLLIFHGGEYSFNDKKEIIHTLTFEDRKIILEAEVPSKVSKEIFKIIAEDIKKFDPSESFNTDDSSYQTERTFCIVHLDVNFMDILSKKFIDFLNNKFASFLKHEYLDIFPKNVRFQIDFKPDMGLYQEADITLSPKTLTIEPRSKEGFKKKIFQTESPFDSDTHLKLLEEFEKLFPSKNKNSICMSGTLN